MENAPFGASGLCSLEKAQLDIGSLTNIEADLKKICLQFVQGKEIQKFLLS